MTEELSTSNRVIQSGGSLHTLRLEMKSFMKSSIKLIRNVIFFSFMNKYIVNVHTRCYNKSVN